ncbi:hypothetical protein MCB86_08995 [Pseudomonas sp. KSR10]|jgi:hypothetical protein|uniref:hypothetical protein n=1 Tax=unclassified Pseudomonas TaxID=196821 RepID=UPI000617AB67|nr:MULTISPECIES: hypothetical protein [unclassified Pseudomonas]KJJ61531.1 hypothetical protein RT21_20035 [Pseudomonas sp. 10B238]MCG6540210.1 hypothetical protein [Pseudomonas sp. KSR10]
MSNPVWPDHFRYIDEIGPEGVSIICKRYVVIRETEHCYWLVVPSYAYVAKARLERGGIPKYAKRVLKESGRRFAYPEKAKALESYKSRKRWQLRHAELATERARAALDEIKDLSAIEDLRICAGGDYIKNLGWEAA